MADIKDYFSLETAAKVAALVKENEGKPGEYWRDLVQNQGIVVVTPFLLALKRSGQFQPIPNASGHLARELYNWEGFITSAPDSAEEQDFAAKVARRYAHGLLYWLTAPLLRDMHGNLKPDSEHFELGAHYAHATELFNQCSWRFYSTSGDDCPVTGKHIVIHTPNWKPTALYLDPNRTLQPLTPAEPAKLIEIKVELHTGNLLINDWFRVGKFAQQVQTKHTLDSRAAIERYVQGIYSEHGFLTIPSIDGSVAIVSNGSSIVGCTIHPDDENLPDHYSLTGHISTDMWAVSIIEYEHLVKIVSEGISHGKEAVDAYLAQQRGDYGLQRMKVEPGTYYLYHAGDHEDLPRLLQQAGITGYEDLAELQFVLSKKKLLK